MQSCIVTGMANKKIKAAVFSLILCCNLAFCLDSPRQKKVKILPFPVFGYSPETGTYVGAVTLLTLNAYNDISTRTSNAKLEFNYTWKKQIILEGEWNYFFKKEKWFSKGKIHYSKYPDYYYGIGGDTPPDNKAIFDSNRFLFAISALKKVGPDLFTGFNMQYSGYSSVGSVEESAAYPELEDGASFGIGYSLLRDTRNSLLTPTRGAYTYFRISYNLSEKNYWKMTLDTRYYKTWKSRITLAVRAVNDLRFGNPPFFDHAFLGGDQFVRGYYYGRYRDKNLSSLQTEIRFPLFWKFGAALFGGLSSLYSGNHPFNLKSIKYNIGLGIRFLVDKGDGTNLRMDYAVGQDNNDGFYMSFGESF